ncbi:hypothetical protein BT63DRAFT_125978 [Microthyrium microscopicum]|uniref:Spt20-like SEP domain-containing protein n=1 Tax=Microthyrium microscopicum TaxID=703497 RepID=A0A6A6TWP7_9PEZI|nr:hypothetical protein BT63DRAFT_125978 [Microthyrium microscopicum]
MSGGIVAPVRQASIGALRQRRDAANRAGLGIVTRAKTVEAEFPPRSQEPAPLVRTAEHILKKFRGYPPSLIIHMHSTYFRFDQQDGNFPYSSAAGKSFLKHFKEKTIPHDLVEEFFGSDTPFYDGCLIVQIHNHRNSSNSAPNASTNQVGATSTHPFSIHNWNEHITPSAYLKSSELMAKLARDDKNKTNGASGAVEAVKESMPAPNQPASASKSQTKGPTVYLTVLFDTPLTLQAEIRILATTPYDDAAMHKRIGSDSGLPHPPTPLASVPSTPINSHRPNPNKKPRMLLDESSVKDFEAQVLLAQNPVLHLEPAKDFAHSQAIMDKLRSPNHDAPRAKPKTRKRTIAEVAAEEAEAAQEEKFLLNYDDRQMAIITSTSGQANANTDGQANSEFTFKRFKTLEQIRAKAESAKHEKELKEAEIKSQQAKAQQAAEEQKKKERDHQLLQASKQKMMQEHKAKQQAHLENMRQQQAAAQQAKLQEMKQAQNSQGSHQNAQMNGMNGMSPIPQQTPISTGPMNQQMPQASAIQMSPIVRHNTPMAGSPSMDGTTMAMSMSSAAMIPTLSNSGAGSPGMQAQHPNMGMVRTMSQQPGQMPPSAAQTPQMHNTPRMVNVGPNQRMTPQPRMQSSPIPGQMQSTPMMMTPSQNPQQQQLTPDQQRMLYQRQLQRNMMVNGQMNLQNLQQMQQQIPGMAQMSQQQQLQILQQMQAQQNARNMQQQQQQNMQPGQQPNMANPQGSAAQQCTQLLSRLQLQARTNNNAQLAQLVINLINKFKELDHNAKNGAQDRQATFYSQFGGVQNCPPNQQRSFNENEQRIMNQQYNGFLNQVNVTWQNTVSSIKRAQAIMQGQQQQQLARQQQQQQVSQQPQQQGMQMSTAGLPGNNMAMHPNNALAMQYAQQLSGQMNQVQARQRMMAMQQQQQLAQQQQQQNGMQNGMPNGMGMQGLNPMQQQQLQQQMNMQNGMQNGMPMGMQPQMGQPGQPGMQGGQHGMGM